MPNLSSIVGLGSSVIGGLGAAQSASDQKQALTSFKPTLYTPAPVATGQEQFLSQGADLPAVAQLLQQVNAQDNAAYQARVLGIDPSLAPSIAALSKKASDYSQGIIAPDVQQKLDRESAERAVQGGYAGSGEEGSSPMADAQKLLSTENYRLNEETNLAPQLNQQAFQYSAALSPTNSDVATTLLSPAALLQRQDQENMYNNQIENQQAQLNAQAQAQKGSILFGSNTGGSGGGTGIGGLGGI